MYFLQREGLDFVSESSSESVQLLSIIKQVKTFGSCVAAEAHSEV